MFTEHIKGNLRAMAKKLSPTLVKLTKLGQVTSIHHTVSTCLPSYLQGFQNLPQQISKFQILLSVHLPQKCILKIDERDKKSNRCITGTHNQQMASLSFS